MCESARLQGTRHIKVQGSLPLAVGYGTSMRCSPRYSTTWLRVSIRHMLLVAH